VGAKVYYWHIGQREWVPARTSLTNRMKWEPHLKQFAWTWNSPPAFLILLYPVVESSIYGWSLEEREQEQIDFQTAAEGHFP